MIVVNTPGVTAPTGKAAVAAADGDPVAASFSFAAALGLETGSAGLDENMLLIPAKQQGSAVPVAMAELPDLSLSDIAAGLSATSAVRAASAAPMTGATPRPHRESAFARQSGGATSSAFDLQATDTAEGMVLATLASTNLTDSVSLVVETVPEADVTQAQPEAGRDQGALAAWLSSPAMVPAPRATRTKSELVEVGKTPDAADAGNISALKDRPVVGLSRQPLQGAYIESMPRDAMPQVSGAVSASVGSADTPLPSPPMLSGPQPLPTEVARLPEVQKTDGARRIAVPSVEGNDRTSRRPAPQGQEAGKAWAADLSPAAGPSHASPLPETLGLTADDTVPSKEAVDGVSQSHSGVGAAQPLVEMRSLKTDSPSRGSPSRSTQDHIGASPLPGIMLQPHAVRLGPDTVAKALPSNTLPEDPGTTGHAMLRPPTGDFQSPQNTSGTGPSMGAAPPPLPEREAALAAASANPGGLVKRSEPVMQVGVSRQTQGSGDTRPALGAGQVPVTANVSPPMGGVAINPLPSGPEVLQASPLSLPAIEGKRIETKVVGKEVARAEAGLQRQRSVAPEAARPISENATANLRGGAVPPDLAVPAIVGGGVVRSDQGRPRIDAALVKVAQGRSEPRHPKQQAVRSEVAPTLRDDRLGATAGQTDPSMSAPMRRVSTRTDQPDANRPFGVRLSEHKDGFLPMRRTEQKTTFVPGRDDKLALNSAPFAAGGPASAPDAGTSGPVLSTPAAPLEPSSGNGTLIRAENSRAFVPQTVWQARWLPGLAVLPDAGKISGNPSPDPKPLVSLPLEVVASVTWQPARVAKGQPEPVAVTALLADEVALDLPLRAVDGGERIDAARQPGGAVAPIQPVRADQVRHLVIGAAPDMRLRLASAPAVPSAAANRDGPKPKSASRGLAAAQPVILAKKAMTDAHPTAGDEAKRFTSAAHAGSHGTGRSVGIGTTADPVAPAPDLGFALAKLATDHPRPTGAPLERDDQGSAAAVASAKVGQRNASDRFVQPAPRAPQSRGATGAPLVASFGSKPEGLAADDGLIRGKGTRSLDEADLASQPLTSQPARVADLVARPVVSGEGDRRDVAIIEGGAKEPGPQVSHGHEPPSETSIDFGTALPALNDPLPGVPTHLAPHQAATPAFAHARMDPLSQPLDQSAGPVAPHGEPRMPRHLPALLAKAARRAEDEGRVELVLDPVELGKVRFEVSSTLTDRVQVHVVVERSETLDLLRRNVESLRAEFREAGFDAATLSFSQWGKGGGAEQGPPLPNLDLMAEQTEDTLPQPQPTPKNTSRHGLDLRL